MQNEGYQNDSGFLELAGGDVDFYWSERRCFFGLWKNCVALYGTVEEDHLDYQSPTESLFSAVSLGVAFEWKRSSREREGV